MVHTAADVVCLFKNILLFSDKKPISSHILYQSGAMSPQDETLRGNMPRLQARFGHRCQPSKRPLFSWTGFSGPRVL